MGWLVGRQPLPAGALPSCDPTVVWWCPSPSPSSRRSRPSTCTLGSRENRRRQAHRRPPWSPDAAAGGLTHQLAPSSSPWTHLLVARAGSSASWRRWCWLSVLSGPSRSLSSPALTVVIRTLVVAPMLKLLSHRTALGDSLAGDEGHPPVQNRCSGHRAPSECPPGPLGPPSLRALQAP